VAGTWRAQRIIQAAVWLTRRTARTRGTPAALGSFGGADAGRSCQGHLVAPSPPAHRRVPSIMLSSAQGGAAA
jgi:hypothetical protein